MTHRVTATLTLIDADARYYTTQLHVPFVELEAQSTAWIFTKMTERIDNRQEGRPFVAAFVNVNSSFTRYEIRGERLFEWAEWGRWPSPLYGTDKTIDMQMKEVRRG